MSCFILSSKMENANFNQYNTYKDKQSYLCSSLDGNQYLATNNIDDIEENGMTSTFFNEQAINKSEIVDKEDNIFLAYNTIYAGMKESKTNIDIYKYKITPRELKNITEKIQRENPDMFYVSGSYSIQQSNSVVKYISPEYTMSDSALNEAKSYYTSEMKKILLGINDEWDDIEKILYVHDYLAINFKYDENKNIVNAYSFFKNKKGVCEAYTCVFNGLMKELGIESSSCISTNMNHIWNIVKINENWYNVDITWDDILPDRIGYVEHTNFILSDSALEKNGYKDYYSLNNQSCTDKTFDNYKWKNSNVPLIYANHNWYLMNNSTKTLYKFDIKTNLTERITDISEKWYVYNTRTVYNNGFSGLVTCNGILYFNTPTKIMRYDTFNNVVTVEKIIPESGYIFSLTSDFSNKLSYYIGKTSSDDKIAIEYLPEYENIHIHEFSRWETPIQETCVSNGYKIRKCNLCNCIEVLTLKATGHEYGDVKIGRQVSCTVNGFSTQVCLKCGDVKKTVLPAQGHIYDDGIVTKEPTCILQGMLTKKCTICGYTFDNFIDKTNHSFGDYVIEKEPTCTDYGIKTRKCSYCGFTETEYIKPKGHNFGKWKTIKVASDEKDGYNERYCEICGEKETQSVAKKGISNHTHNFSEWKLEIKETCKEEGYYTRICNCGAEENKTVAKTAHIYSEWEISKQATCTKNGLRKKECKICGNIESEIIYSTGHQMSEWEKEYDATINSHGSYISKCKFCSYTETKTIAKLSKDGHEHIFTDWKITVQPTEYENGTAIRHCTVDGCDAYETKPILVGELGNTKQKQSTENNKLWMSLLICIFLILSCAVPAVHIHIKLKKQNKSIFKTIINKTNYKP